MPCARKDRLPENDEGLPSFRLEHLTVANGIEHQNAHDAMADVYATIAMAKLVKPGSRGCLIISTATAISASWRRLSTCRR
nr:hypothetical protein [Klebsiella pneumoniae subsp. pneumoniae]